MTQPPADRKHGTGDRNESDVAKHDEKLHDHRDDAKKKDAEDVTHQSHHDMGIEHP